MHNNHIKIDLKEFPRWALIYWDTLVYSWTQSVMAMYIKNYTANFASHINICTKFQMNQITSSTVIASHADRNTNTFPSIGHNVLRQFCVSLYLHLALTPGLCGRAQHPVVLFSILYAPCGPFRHPICILRPFSASYMRPAALFDTLYAPGRPFRHFICARRPFLFTSLHLSVCLSVSHPKGFWMQARRVPKIVKKFTEDYVTIFEEFVHSYRRN